MLNLKQAKVSKITLNALGVIGKDNKTDAITVALNQNKLFELGEGIDKAEYRDDYHVSIPAPLYNRIQALNNARNESIAQTIHFMITGNKLEYVSAIKKTMQQQITELTARIELLESRFS